jgi:PTH1 family peptidyl-tRNA hydrolase
MIAIFGLGNPDKKYELTRHNLGFDVINQWQQKHSDFFSEFSLNQKFSSQIAEGIWDNKKILLVKPLTFMNLSGQAVAKIKSFYQLSNNAIWVIHDDLDLLPGRIKISVNASAGGHNGIASIIDDLGDKNFIRFRIGIGKPGFFGSTSNYVLKKPNNQEIITLDQAKEKILTALASALRDGLPKTQSLFNN